MPNPRLVLLLFVLCVPHFACGSGDSRSDPDRQRREEEIKERTRNALSAPKPPDTAATQAVAKALAGSQPPTPRLENPGTRGLVRPPREIRGKVIAIDVDRLRIRNSKTGEEQGFRVRRTDQLEGLSVGDTVTIRTATPGLAEAVLKQP
jgi:hypothetical protein